MTDLKKELFEYIGNDFSLFDFLQESALDGLCYLNINDPNHLWFNNKVFKVLNLDNLQEVSFKKLLNETFFKGEFDHLINTLSTHFNDSKEPIDLTVKLKRKDQNPCFMRFRAMPLVLNGIFEGKVLCALTDLTETVKKDEFLNSSNTDARIGYWDLDLINQTLHWSDETKRIHETSLDFKPSLETALSFYKEGHHRNKLTELVNKAIETGETFCDDFLIQTEKGNEKWVRSIGKPDFEEGNCVRIYGTFQDIHEQKENQINLALNEQKIRGIFDSTYSLIGFLSTDGILIEANQSALNFGGVKEEDIIGKYFWTLPFWSYSKKVQKELKANIQKVCEGEHLIYETQVLNKDKQKITISLSLSPVFDDDGKVIFVVPEGRPIQEIVEVINSYKSVIDGTGLGTWEWNVQTGETSFNERWAEIVGYTIEELMPITIDTWGNLVHPDDRIESDRRVQEVFDKKSDFYEMEARMKHKNGSWVWIYDRGKVFSWTEDGKPLMMFGTHEDITARKEQSKKLEAFIDQAPTASSMFDKDLKFIAASEKWHHDYKVPEEDIKGKSLQEVFPNVGEKWTLRLQKALLGETQKADEDLITLNDGSQQWIRFEVKPWRNDLGQIGGIIFYSEDITEKKAIQEELFISENSFRENFQNAAIGMALVSPEGHWIEVNQTVCDIVGYSEEELKKLTFADITHPEDLNADLSLLQQLVEGKIKHYQLEKRYIHKEGHEVPILLAVSMVKDQYENVHYFISQIIDISNLKEVEKRLAYSLQKTQSILDASTQVSIIATDKFGTITSFNKGAENLLGYNASEMVNLQTPQIIHLESEVIEVAKELSLKYGEEVKGFKTFVEEANRGRPDTREWTYVAKSGRRFPVQLTVTPMMENEEIVGYLGIAADISKIKQAEKEVRNLLEYTTDQNSRLENFAHIVSHNLRSHSAGVTMLVDMYLEEFPELCENEIIQHLDAAAKNLDETIKHLTEVVEINASSKEKLISNRLKSTVDNTLDSIRSLAQSEKVALYNEISSDVKVLAIPAYLESIILNLATNAIKYKSPSKEGYLRISAQKQGRYIDIFFEDNGLGINLNMHKKKIFGMYKTFHYHKDSRGIGLFMTKNQIESMEGKIDVKSEENVGTTFKVSLLNGED